MSALEGKAAIVTGASSGIGAATARALARAGASVALAARREDRLHALRDEIEADGGRALVVATDVTDRAAVQRLADRAKEAFGAIDVLVNNAGVMPLSYLKNMHVDEWLKMVDVNVNGVLHGIAAVLPTMMAQRSGFVVNVSSVAGRSLFPGGAVYCGTKFAVRAISEGMRQELTPTFGIRVTCIEPGAVATELGQGITDEELMRDTAGLFDGVQFLEADDIARSILHTLEAPPHVDVSEVLIMPSGQAR
ncbi:MAG: SDR family oxidoreductase [Rhodothermales bacterium]